MIHLEEVLALHKKVLLKIILLLTVTSEKEIMMTKLTVQLQDSEYKQLQNLAASFGKTVQEFIQEWISQLPKIDPGFDVKQDPVFRMQGHDSDAPADLSENIDDYLYGDK